MSQEEIDETKEITTYIRNNLNSKNEHLVIRYLKANYGISENECLFYIRIVNSEKL
jgi:hypothetical protein